MESDDPLSSMLLSPSPSPYHPSPLSGNQDLVTLFGLKGMYDTHVRPTIQPSIVPSASQLPVSNGTASPTKPNPTSTPTLTMTTKTEKSYYPLIADIPGRNKIKKDTHFHSLISQPPSMPPEEKLDSSRVELSAFGLKMGTIPGFDRMVWESTGGIGGERREKGKSHKKKKKREREENTSTNGNGQESDRANKKQKN